MDKAIQEVVDCIINSKEYQECLKIKQKMDKNEDIKSRVNKIKKLQKEYLRTNSLEIEEQLKRLEEELNEIPLYVIYNQNLEIVNQKINYVQEEINDYFYKLFNKKDY